MINGKTKTLGIIGNPIAHSLSPAMHNAAFAEKGLNMAYMPFLVNDVENAVNGVRALGIHGLSVTIPFKLKVGQYLDELDNFAKGAGSVNTIYRKDGKLIGGNSDGRGALRALQQSTELDGKSLCIIGNGGSAMAIASALLLSAGKVNLNILGRNIVKLEDFSRRLKDASGMSIDTGLISESSGLISSADVIINTTPVGMKEEALPIDENLINEKQTVFDIVYTPKDTALLKAAKARGATIVYGYKMLLYQAVIQFELWTGEEAPTELMERVLTERSEENA